MRCAWLIYGSLDQLTGGYVYDRLVVEGLRRAGHVIDVIDVDRPPESMPEVGRQIFEGGYACVVGDELCHPELAVVFEAVRQARQATSDRPALVLLVHHLAASETGVMHDTERHVLTRCDHVITTSRTTALQVSPWVHAPVTVCVPGADRLPKLARVDNDVAELRVLFVGTWTPRKGLLRALEYLRCLPEAGFRFHVVGDGARDASYAASVRLLLDATPWLSSRTQIYGAVADAELASIYSRADVLLLPSSYEGYGMVLTEALHAGVGVLAANVGATAEVVRHEHDGLLLSLGDAQRWVHTLRLLANDRALLARWSEAPRCLPTWTATVADFARVLLGV